MNENSEKLQAQIEALLFAYGEPLEVKRIAETLKIGEEAVTKALQELEKNYEGDSRGLTLISHGERVQLATKPAFAGVLDQLAREELREELTPAALETLAIVAYAGPLARSSIDYIRGVNSSFILRALLMRGLVERAPDPQRPNTYRYSVSFDFLKHLGLSRAENLPEYQPLREIVRKFNVELA